MTSARGLAFLIFSLVTNKVHTAGCTRSDKTSLAHPSLRLILIDGHIDFNGITTSGLDVQGLRLRTNITNIPQQPELTVVFTSPPNRFKEPITPPEVLVNSSGTTSTCWTSTMKAMLNDTFCARPQRDVICPYKRIAPYSTRAVSDRVVPFLSNSRTRPAKQSQPHLEH